MKAQREALRGIGGHLLPLPMVVVASGNAHKLQELGRHVPWRVSASLHESRRLRGRY